MQLQLYHIVVLVEPICVVLYLGGVVLVSAGVLVYLACGAFVCNGASSAQISPYEVLVLVRRPRRAIVRCHKRYTPRYHATKLEIVPFAGVARSIARVARSRPAIVRSLGTVVATI